MLASRILSFGGLDQDAEQLYEGAVRCNRLPLFPWRERECLLVEFQHVGRLSIVGRILKGSAYIIRCRVFYRDTFNAHTRTLFITRDEQKTERGGETLETDS